MWILMPKICVKTPLPTSRRRSAFRYDSLFSLQHLLCPLHGSALSLISGLWSHCATLLPDSFPEVSSVIRLLVFYDDLVFKLMYLF